MTLSILLKCWLCNNVDLVLLWISRVLGGNALHDGIFKAKCCEKADFLQFRHFFQAEMGKAFSGQNRGLTTPARPLVAIGELQRYCVNTKNNLSNKKTLFRSVISSHNHIFFHHYNGLIKLL